MNTYNIPKLLRLGFLFILCIFSSLLLSAQDFSLSGEWTGKIYQTNGSVKTEYNITIYLHHLPNKIIGRSYISADEISAEIKISGICDKNGIFEYKDIEILNSKQGEEMSWCLKNVSMKLNSSVQGWQLKGTWTGKNEYSPCNPGTIILKKVTNRA